MPGNKFPHSPKDKVSYLMGCHSIYTEEGKKSIQQTRMGRKRVPSFSKEGLWVVSFLTFVDWGWQGRWEAAGLAGWGHSELFSSFCTEERALGLALEKWVRELKILGVPAWMWERRQMSGLSDLFPYCYQETNGLCLTLSSSWLERPFSRMISCPLCPVTQSSACRRLSGLRRGSSQDCHLDGEDQFDIEHGGNMN